MLETDKIKSSKYIDVRYSSSSTPTSFRSRSEADRLHLPFQPKHRRCNILISCHILLIAGSAFPEKPLQSCLNWNSITFFFPNSCFTIKSLFRLKTWGTPADLWAVRASKKEKSQLLKTTFKTGINFRSINLCTDADRLALTVNWLLPLYPSATLGGRACHIWARGEFGLDRTETH